VAVPETNIFNLAVEGEVKEDGDKIKDGQAINSDGNSFVFQCKLDPECTVAPTARGNSLWGQR
jgi:hypothetical protein